MNDPKYDTLINILDNIRKQAPDTAEFSRFHSKNPDDILYSRGQAFIHLLLQVKFGLETFTERDQYITDGQQDGGLDAYFISETQKAVYLIQSKFKNTCTGFINESISTSDLVNMELERILRGETKDSNGIAYNPKIHEFQLNLNQATRRQVFNHKVIFLANLKQYNDYQIRKLTTNLDYEVYDFVRSYLELAKPICSGTYYDPEKIVIELDISEKSAPQLSQSVSTTYGDCEVTAVFVPTSEIGRVMSTYKNAILRYNPRNYLGLSKNLVNKEIRNSITSILANDFALLNNGITILADEQEFTLLTGVKNVGRLTLTNPQIINGGQTAYTLSEIYETDYNQNPSVFNGKEVLVRVVVLKQQSPDTQKNKYGFIESISTSTNQQTQVKVADRQSSNPILIKIQKEIFVKYGFFLELKKGEFYNGLSKGFMNKAFVIDRIIILRSYYAFRGYSTVARSQSEPKLYDANSLKNIFPSDSSASLPLLASRMFFAYAVHRFLVSKDKQIGKKSLEYGYSLRYGKYALVYAAALSMDNKFKLGLRARSLDEINQYIEQKIPLLLDNWKKFEVDIQKLATNKSYFDPDNNLTDFDSYYKGPTLKTDLERFFGPN